MNIRRYLKKISAAVCICLLPACILLFPVRAQEEETKESSIISCAAFGDSIAKGYGGRGSEDLKSYSEILMEKISEETKRPAECRKHGKNGLDSSRLNSEIFDTEEAAADMEVADIITLTIGANDLMQEFKGAAQEVLGTERRFASAYDAMDALMEGVEGNPLLIMKVLDVLNNWDYDGFEEQWILAMEKLSAHRKESSQLIVTNIYNPVSGFELPASMNQIVEDIILNMNEIMYQYGEKYDYYVVDLFSSDICDNLQEDGLHPNQEGQEIIAELVLEKVDTGRFIGKPEKEIKKESGPERAVRRRFSLWNVFGPVPFLLGTLLLLLILLAFWQRIRRRKNHLKIQGKDQ